MSLDEGIEDAGDDVRCPLWGERSAYDLLAEQVAFHQLEHHEQRPVVVEAEVEQGDRVRMAEAGDAAIERHRAIGMGYVRFAVEHPAYFRLMAGRRDIFEPDAEFDAAYQQLFETIREAAVAAQREGWAVGRDPDDLLLTSWSVVHGFAKLWVEGAIQDHFGPIDPEVAAGAVIDIVLRAGAQQTRAPKRGKRSSQGA